MFYKTILKTDFMFDEDRNELFRFHKYKKDWTQFDINHIPTKTYRYIKIGIDKKKFLLHRVIYFICNEDFDLFDLSFVIDHVDRNTGNNKLSNLSKRTISENNQNTNKKGINLVIIRLKTKSPRLYFSVFWRKDQKTYVKRVKNYWIARWLRNIKTKHYYKGNY
jgi:hypothetical protein